MDTGWGKNIKPFSAVKSLYRQIGTVENSGKVKVKLINLPVNIREIHLGAKKVNALNTSHEF